VLSTKLRRYLLRFGAAVAVLYALLLIPEPEPDVAPLAPRQAFVWNQDERWEALEANFAALHRLGCAGLGARIDSGETAAARLIDRLIVGTYEPGDPLLSDLESSLFALAPLVAVCPDRARDYLGLVVRMRTALKEQSLRWDMNDLATRQRIYRLLYGGRAASEEALLQMPSSSIPPLIECFDEPSRTPATNVLGMTIHSGDILVSRGGAAASALIARGNDYPGNFSHAAIVYVDPDSHVAQVIESHIEQGVAVASFPQYLQDTKLRVMVLRLRSDHPAMKADPILAHKAAERALKSSRERHIPYDFTMDIRDTSEMFCSEVVSSPYSALGIDLWMGMSTISSPGVAAWLSGFGARHFVTQEPSDLEYDPQLRVVAEWRDPDALLKDHVDNAIIEALLEGAEAGERIPIRWYLLPIARLAKLYSVILNSVGWTGPIPEGMSSTSSLRYTWLVDRHATMKASVFADVERFRRENDYTPPYWELLKMARRAKAVN
jgi:hypothetical protein